MAAAVAQLGAARREHDNFKHGVKRPENAAYVWQDRALSHGQGRTSCTFFLFEALALLPNLLFSRANSERARYPAGPRFSLSIHSKVATVEISRLGSRPIKQQAVVAVSLDAPNFFKFSFPQNNRQTVDRSFSFISNVRSA